MCTSSEGVAENYSVSLIDWLQFNGTFSTTRQYRAFKSMDVNKTSVSARRPFLQDRHQDQDLKLQDQDQDQDQNIQDQDQDRKFQDQDQDPQFHN